MITPVNMRVSVQIDFKKIITSQRRKNSELKTSRKEPEFIRTKAANSGGTRPARCHCDHGVRTELFESYLTPFLFVDARAKLV
ncbi:hypothetical protein K0M31_014719 [Melipona bicolor]|uniref:Uncharacterized protein n=1 Tax=Melipona bicolor TaxID=60889 RepID=A0AA40FGR2_9HYME|nr:hypothetical protein K0M31_014719 [Melipona bicolor]